MCAISGCIVLRHCRPDPAALVDTCHRALLDGRVRGSDSFGAVCLDRNGRLGQWKGEEPPGRDDLAALIGPAAAVVLTISRATPTTEWRRAQTLSDAQPFISRRWAVVHNGIVANDEELRTELGVIPVSRVDSAVLPHLFEADGFASGLSRVRGSFALAAVDCRNPDVLHLARNFKPLWFSRPHGLGAVVFASTRDQLISPADGVLDLTAPAVVESPPYHRVTIDADGQVDSAPLAAPTVPRRALVVASGGLDSTVAAALTQRAGASPTLLHFRYGCRAESREVEAVHAVADALGCDVKILPLDWLRELGASPLTTGGEIAPGEVGAEYPHEWVPARNMVMLAAASALADAEGYTDIVTGTNLEEGGAYPDNTQGFIEAMDRAAQLGTLRRPQITAPLGNLVKHQIVRTGVEVDAPLDRTWSCYRNGRVHCGACGPCFMRRVAFVINGVRDPVPYKAPLVRVRPV